MPALETDFLKGLIDEKDKLHRAAVKALQNVHAKGWRVCSAAFLELDLLLKAAGLSPSDRYDIFQSLSAELPDELILATSHKVVAAAALFQRKYNYRNFYFDSIHLSAAYLHDGQIGSSDKQFDEISEVKRLSLEKL